MAKEEDLLRVLETHRAVVEDGYVSDGSPRYRSYAVSTLRGGVGKSTLAFNLAYELAGKAQLLIADSLRAVQHDRGADAGSITRGQHHPCAAARPPRPGVRPGTVCADVQGGELLRCVPHAEGLPADPGSAEMFAFPSTLYQQLQIANAQSRPEAVNSLLESLKTVLAVEANNIGAESILMDTSPFYAAGRTWHGARRMQ